MRNKVVQSESVFHRDQLVARHLKDICLTSSIKAKNHETK